MAPSTALADAPPPLIFGLPRQGVLGLLVALAYGCSSAALALLNKTLLSGYHFDGYFFLLAAQMGLQLLLCSVTREFGNPFGVPAFSRATYTASLRMGISGVANVALGFVALQMVNVPMFLCIRRLVAPCILAFEFFALGKVAEPAVQGAVGAILMGTLIAGWETLHASILGYSLTLGNNVISAAYSVLTKEFSVAHRTGVVGTLYYNAITAFPLAVAGCVLSGEAAALMSFHYLRDPAFWMNFSICVAMGPIITFSTILCTTFNSPLATSITGNVKDIFVTVAGALLFPGFAATAASISGLTLSFIGAGLYSYVSLRSAMGPSAAASGGDKGGAGGAATAPVLEGGSGGGAGGSSSLATVEEEGSLGGEETALLGGDDEGKGGVGGEGVSAVITIAPLPAAGHGVLKRGSVAVADSATAVAVAAAAAASANAAAVDRRKV